MATHTLSRRAALTGVASVLTSPVSAKPDPIFAIAPGLLRHCPHDIGLLLFGIDIIAALPRSLRAELLSFVESLPDDEEAAFERVGQLGALMRETDA